MRRSSCSPIAPSALVPASVWPADDADLVREICRRLDGMPLAIELAAARVRALSLAQIVASLNDQFRLLTGGARTAVRRQQTLRASVDWSHALLTDPERNLFRRLAVFQGGFDLEATQAVGGSTEVERYQILDQLSLLVDKSLVVAEDVSGTMRYRLLETAIGLGVDPLRRFWHLRAWIVSCELGRFDTGRAGTIPVVVAKYVTLPSVIPSQFAGCPPQSGEDPSRSTITTRLR